MSWYHSFRPYVSVGERRRKAEVAARKLSNKGRALAPVRLDGRKIAATFWGKSWCDNLESYSDYANRLPRGRSYVRNGAVIDLQITAGKVEALVQGYDLYRITVAISPLGAKRWRDFKRTCAGKVTNLLDLLQGRLSKEILADITTRGSGLFPAPKEITLGCSCPDWAGMCKHLAAVLYGVGARLDAQPELFFTLRGVEMHDLIAAAGATAVTPIDGAAAAGAALDGADLSEIFGVDIEAVPESRRAPASARASKTRKEPGARPRKSARKSSATPVTARAQKRVARRAGKTRSASGRSGRSRTKPRKA